MFTRYRLNRSRFEEFLVYNRRHGTEFRVRKLLQKRSTTSEYYRLADFDIVVNQMNERQAPLGPLYLDMMKVC